MSLFSKIEVNPNMIPFIEKHEGVGIVKVDGYGKASARIESYKLILESYKDENPIIESIAAINYLSYKKGNFFNEPKLKIGISHKKYTLAGVDNNDDELESFYKKLLDIKNKEKDQNLSSHANKVFDTPKPGVKEIITDDKLSDVEEDVIDKKPTYKVVDLEKEVIQDNSEDTDETEENILDEIIEEENELEESKSTKEVVETFDIEDDNNEDFEVLAEISEDEIDEEINKEESKEVKSKDDNVDEEDEEEEFEDVELKDDNVDEEDEEEEFEEIILNNQEGSSKTQNGLIIEEPDDIEELKDEEIELDRVINESDTQIDQKDSVEKEIDLEDDLEEDTIEESEEKKESKEKETSETKNIPQSEEVVSQSSTEDMKTSKEKTVPKKDVNQKISQNIQDKEDNVIVDNPQFKQYIPTPKQVDPIDQIRRYHELKEEGIITEEEFEQKKKQLLDL